MSHYGGWEEELLACRGQRPRTLLNALILQAQDDPHTENEPTQNVSNAKVEKPGASPRNTQEGSGWSRNGVCPLT